MRMTSLSRLDLEVIASLLHSWLFSLLHLWANFITFMVSITFMVGITFMAFITCDTPSPGLDDRKQPR